MTNRRDFLQSAAVLSASPLAARTAFAVSRAPLSPDFIVIDSRHSDALSFGASARHFGSKLREIEGDVTDLWQRELLARWKRNPAPIAGLTERPALFLLERLAWDQNLRVVFEAEHVPDGQGARLHRVVRTDDPGLVLELEIAGPAWPELLAHKFFSNDRVTTRDFRPSGAAMASHLGEPTKLYSWVIAPRHAG